MLMTEIMTLAYQQGAEWDAERKVYVFSEDDLKAFATALIERAKCWQLAGASNEPR